MGHRMADEDDALRHARTPSSSLREARVRDRRRPGSADDRLALGEQARDRERHREPVIVVGLGDRARQRPATVDLDVVALDADVRAEAP